MINLTESFVESLGNEPIEVLGFDNEEELEVALDGLMEDISN